MIELDKMIYEAKEKLERAQSLPDRYDIRSRLLKAFKEYEELQGKVIE